jgi:hypothetical protein
MTIRFPTPVADPLEATPARAQDSVRLTSHIDVHTEPNGELFVAGAARELRTTTASTDELAAARMTATLAAGRVLEVLDSRPRDARTAQLVGSVVGSGFRSKVRDVFGGGSSADAVELLLDDLPAAALISGYASLYSGEMKIAPKHLDRGLLRADICSGWREDGTMLVTLKTKGQFPVPIGPPANSLESSTDREAWHEIEPLGPGAMRRRRLIDLAPLEDSDALRVFAMFRDTHVGHDGVESILHEYCLSAGLDRSREVITECVAQPRVLPWAECPAAADSASRLNGLRLDELNSYVGRELRGTSTCTHLNDLLRSLSKLTTLLSRMP